MSPMSPVFACNKVIPVHPLADTGPTVVYQVAIVFLLDLSRLTHYFGSFLQS